jgi:predicted membrane-bound spermidine synthase
VISLAYLLFALSGAAGLIYESVWSRYLALLVGHTAYAQVLVLAIFLGGMAAGAVLAGVYSERLRDPLKLYAIAELLVGLFGLAFHWMFTGVSSLAYEMIFPALGPGILLTLVKWLIAGLLILPQAVLLGSTFPLMVAAVLRRAPHTPGRVLGSLYFSNNLGAAIGVLVAGFLLLAVGGLPGTILSAAAINLFVATMAYGLAARIPAERSAYSKLKTASGGDRPAANNLMATRLTQLLLAVSFGTAAASFCYEIGWLRMLALVLGSATHTFEIMLSAFILGLALGSFWIRTRADSLSDPLRALGVVQWIMGLTALATLPLYAETFGWTEWMLQAFAKSDAGFLMLSLGKYGVGLAVMLPSTICAGMTLPLITRTLLVNGGGEKSIGAVYGANTVGSIAGVALAGLVILPLAGVRNLIIGGAVLDMAIGVTLLIVAARAANRGSVIAYGSAVLVVGAVLVISVMPRVDREVLSAGVFRYGSTMPEWMEEVRFYRDGRTATISVYETSEPRRLVIATNGKADGSLPVPWLGSCSGATARMTLSGDAATQMLGPLITLAHAPDARRAAVIGHGTGMSGHFLLGYPGLEEVTTVEIEPQMIEGSRIFYPANARVFDDPRSLIVLEDARTHFAAGGVEYDAIFSEPSNPWVSGVASLFTTEFYGHVERHLSDAGVFGQWLHLYEIDDTLVLSVLAGIHEHFATYALFRTSGGDILILASKSAALPVPDWSIFESPTYMSDFCHIDSLTAGDLEATRVADDVVFRSLLEDWQETNSDFHPHLDLGADRARFVNDQADGFLELGTEVVDMAAALAERPLGPPPTVRPPPVNIARLAARSKAAYLLSLDSDTSKVVASGGGLESSRYYYELWRNMVQSNNPPSDWRTWLEHFRAVDADRSSGIAGVPDDELYALALGYVETQQAPNIVRLAVLYQQALAAWDTRAASRTLDLILSETNRQGGSMHRLTEWIPATLLVEGGVTAKLAIGDRRGARNLYEALEALYPHPANHLRRMLVESLVK